MPDTPPLSCIPPDADFTFTSGPTKPTTATPTKPTTATSSKQAKPAPRANTTPSTSTPPKSTKAQRTSKNTTDPSSTKNTDQKNPSKPTPNRSNGSSKPVERSAEDTKKEGNEAFKLKKFSEALALYTEAVKLDPKNTSYLTNRAAALMALKRYEAAIKDMQLATSPAFSETEINQKPSLKNLLRLSRCHIALGQFFQSKQILNKLLIEYPSNNSIEIKKEIEKLLDLENTLKSIENNRIRKDWSMVIFGLDKLQRDVEGGCLISKEWLGWKVEALCGKKRWDEAQSIATTLVRNHSSDPEALYYRALVMYLQGNLSAAITHCQESLRCDPDFKKARDLLRQSRSIETLKESGNIAFKSSDYTTANEKYLQALNIDPKNEAIKITLLSNRAQSLFKLKFYKQSIEICNEILKIEEFHFKALRTRAKCKNFELEFDSAILDFEKCLKKNCPTEKDKIEILKEIKLTKIKLAKSKFKDHYEILGVSRRATDDEIKKAFRKQSLVHHPDKGGNEEKFKEINESYSVLQNPTTRRQFDMVDPDDPEPSCHHEHNSDGFDLDDDQLHAHMAYMFGRNFGGSRSRNDYPF